MTRCHDCDERPVCCMEEVRTPLAVDQRDENAARMAAALREHCPPGTPLNNRAQRRRAAKRYGVRV